jgi:hypothetical protein
VEGDGLLHLGDTVFDRVTVRCTPGDPATTPSSSTADLPRQG